MFRFFANAGRNMDDEDEDHFVFSKSLRSFDIVYNHDTRQNELDDLEYGGKVFLPPSFLDMLMNFNIQYPMMFQLINMQSENSTHCGVLEFTAEEGKIYMPRWMMRQIKVNNGDIILIKYVPLPKGTYAKLEPQSTEFLNISNPRVVLEKKLAMYSCLSIGDVITFSYNGTNYDIKIIELKPSNAVCIVECDINVDFAPPVGYVEPEKEKIGSEMPEAPELPTLKDVKNKIFPGSGFSLNGKDKRKNNRKVGIDDDKKILPEIVVNENYKPGNLNFMRYNYKNRVIMEQMNK
uniref:Ubiquitin fusion degradation protein 1 homolog n=1 Tax=Parastrongyloides trichosuri TaxID=131310 RepID=A0A0N4ZQS7_PARTI